MRSVEFTVVAKRIAAAIDHFWFFGYGEVRRLDVLLLRPKKEVKKGIEMKNIIT